MGRGGLAVEEEAEAEAEEDAISVLLLLLCCDMRRNECLISNAPLSLEILLLPLLLLLLLLLFLFLLPSDVGLLGTLSTEVTNGFVLFTRGRCVL